MFIKFFIPFSILIIVTHGQENEEEYTIIPPESKSNIMIVSRITSGSTFFAELIQSYDPKTFYSFEPLIQIDRKSHLRENKKLNKSIDFLNHIYGCKMNKLKFFFNFLLKKSRLGQIRSNKYLMQSLDPKILKHLKVNEKFLNESRKMCQSANVNLIKVNRLRMSQVGIYLDQLNKTFGEEFAQKFKVIFLVRDPRGIFSSRRTRKFSKGIYRNPKLICDDMEQNLMGYIDVKIRYPNNVFLVRYEDVSIDPMKFSSEFFPKILNLSMNENIMNFIQTHTVRNIKKNIQHRKSSTIRNSHELTFIWTKRLKRKKIVSFDQFCAGAINLAGYKLWREAKKENRSYKNVDWTKKLQLFQ